MENQTPVTPSRKVGITVRTDRTANADMIVAMAAVAPPRNDCVDHSCVKHALAGIPVVEIRPAGRRREKKWMPFNSRPHRCAVDLFDVSYRNGPPAFELTRRGGEEPVYIYVLARLGKDPSGAPGLRRPVVRRGFSCRFNSPHLGGAYLWC